MWTEFRHQERHPTRVLIISQFVVSYRGKELWVILEVTKGRLYINCYDHGYRANGKHKKLLVIWFDFYEKKSNLVRVCHLTSIF